MGFRNPITSIAAEDVEAGELGPDVVARRLRTGTSGKYWDIGSTPSNHIIGNDGVPGDDPGYLEVDVAVDQPVINLVSGAAAGYNPAALQLLGEDPSASNPSITSQISLQASNLVAPGFSVTVDPVTGEEPLTMYSRPTAAGLPIAQSLAASKAVTTDAGGIFTLTHNFGDAQHVLLALANSGTGIVFRIVGRTANTTTCQAYEGTVPVASRTFTIFYLVAAV